MPKTTKEFDVGSYHGIVDDDFGVRIYDIEDKDEKDGFEYANPVLHLAPKAAIALAKHILIHEKKLEEDDVRLHGIFDKESKLVLESFPQIWKEFRPEDREPNCHDLSSNLKHTYVTLRLAKKIEFHEEEYEYLFWRHFYRKYEDQLVKEYLQQEEEE